jgi:sugar lactone lactonase YvrE
MNMIRKIGVTAVGCALSLMMGLLGTAPANAWQRGHVQLLTVLPNAAPGVQSSVEGLTVGPDGNIYVPTFGFNTTGQTTGPATLFVISPGGKVLRQVTIKSTPSPATAHMLGLAFNPVTQALLVLDFGAGNVLNVDPVTGNAFVFATAPSVNGGTPGINALTFDQSGNVYVSDSFQGIIWKAPPNCRNCTMTQWSLNSTPPLLGPGTGLTPPFGANGVEFSNDYSTMYVADTAFHQIIQIPVINNGGTLIAGTPSILITGINAPDGIAVDRKGNIWVCANQEDEIVVIDPKAATDPTTGKPLAKVIAKLGDFYGIDQNGIAQGFLFPASLAFSKDGQTLYVSNLTLFLPYAQATVAIDSAWTLQVKGYTVSQISASIPPLNSGDDDSQH